ncbi:MAG: protein kinase [Deltaproteobacteria bacterium]|nr:protein kinase [Deltaproteobacteria bacterium]
MENNFLDHESAHSRTAAMEGAGYSQVHPNYAIFNPICTDATGTLYRGKSVLDDRITAVKLFDGDVTPALVNVDVGSPRLGNLIGVNEVLSGNRGVPLAVMDLPGGACLEKLLSKKGKLPVGAAVHITLNLSLIVRALHMHNVIHGHINAQSVFLKRQSNGRIGVQLLHHQLVGRPARFNLFEYLSPELVGDSDALMPRDDNWAIAVLLHTMIFGVPPFAGNIREETARRVLKENLSLPSAFEREFASVSSVLKKSLRRDPDSRPSGREMNLLLKSVLANLSDTSDTAATGSAADAVAAQPFGVEVPRSVPAESFLDEDLRDTRPEPVVPQSDAVSSLIPEGRLKGTSSDNISGYSPFLSEEMRDTSPGSYTMSDLDETPVSGYSPIEADDIMEVDIDQLITPGFPQDPLSNDKNAIVLAEFENISSLFPRNPHLQSIHLVHSVSGEATRARRIRYLVAAMTGLAIIAVVLTSLYITVWRSSDDADDHVVAVSGQNAVAGQNLANTVAAAEPAPKIENTAESSVETITVTLKGLPPAAHVTLNGMEAELPLTMPRSDSPVAVQAIVGNRIVFAETLVPTQSQTFYVAGSLEKSHKSKRRNKRDDGTNETASSRRDATGSLSSNPYQLKRNPFATGAK